MSRGIDHIAGRTFHGRRGAVKNAFAYGVDYVMLDAEAALRPPCLFGRNRGNLFALWDSDHGGPPKQGQGAPWARAVLAAQGLDHAADGRLMLLAQPRTLGHVFNPVSFWLAEDRQGQLRAVIVEVTNTFGDRHSYLCAHQDAHPIDRTDTLTARKIFHVSPFQPIGGGYTFRFDIRPERIGIRIDYRTGAEGGAEGGGEGLVATLTGRRKPLGNPGILCACLCRPFGSRRVLGLIHWQALKLWWKGARYRTRPVPPADEVSQ
ncbi:MAG: DUF1365 domain-containing protein [Rhodobacteraceae bacterium]|nr:DUF1365 domain-containing protein [Paracoccaceae bacterium]